ncbi:MAG: adenylate kinase [Clostridia bacterium]|nr:adenylate kinase [Clostridia bacterium]
MKLIILGAPGSGKGTQAEKISQKLGIPAISTGAIIRETVAEGTPAGKAAQKYIESGNLLPDDVIIAMIEERLAQPDCSNGYILDGFPRTLPQAEAAEKMGIEVDKVLSMEVADSAIVERLSGRRECEACHTPYHVLFNAPAKENVCDKCAGRLICRKDDEPETIQKRLNVYHTQTEPLKEFYEKKGLLVTARGHEEISDTTKEVFSVLGI